ncbi:hypothetical protein AK812_SmicGene33203 [Symbiodinium microadriaticum]|uniref:Uncharacterized protein n=1 Tax=Symbiodinium microadriaticum TaxID=2951 RepID=A0A1Q9CS76_SYMMI|nr:hypothetical protein AK812_SmicGene33203 [Symbiodinium microadriaticum]
MKGCGLWIGDEGKPRVSVRTSDRSGRSRVPLPPDALANLQSDLVQLSGWFGVQAEVFHGEELKVNLQRRQLAAETAEGAEWIRHLGSMLDRYAEELGYVCYFCSERFTAAAANTRCGWNQPTSPSGRALSPDRRVPQHLSGSGAHFWVPLPSPASAAAAAAVAGTGPDFREHHAFQQHWASAQVPLPPPPPPPPWVEFPEAWAPPPPQVSSGSRAASPSATRYGGQSFAGPTAPRRELAAFGQAGPGGAGDVPVPVSRGPAAFVERRCGGGGPLPAAEARSGDLLAVLRGREEAEGFALV